MSATANLSFDANAATFDRRLWLALAASVLAHWVALIIFAGLLLPLPLPVWVSLGQPAVVEVVLASPEPPAVAAQPDTPVDVAKPPLGDYTGAHTGSGIAPAPAGARSTDTRAPDGSESARCTAHRCRDAGRAPARCDLG